MNQHNPQPDDEMTVLLDHQGQGPTQAPLTTASDAPRFAQLQERMVYSAEARPAAGFSLGLNALVAAASALLSSIVRIRLDLPPPDISQLNNRLREQVRQFEWQALRDGIDSEQLNTARYVLCTVLDEQVVTTEWGRQSDWAQNSLLSHFHNETFGGDKFFRLLEQLSRNPVRHLPLLELMYLCLALGFEGRYRVRNAGHVELEEVRDALYRQIRQLRGEASGGLTPAWPGVPDSHQATLRIVPWWMVLLFTLAGLAMLYGGFAWVLDEQRQSVLQPWQVAVPSLIQNLP
ncbi:type IVB secretion system protein IcmH/DotU [Pseudomonas sp. LJDD11]|uniref:type IVB secretion system protein IcmH/DotU n=1 Tax=unclassified Pseudomonas TaxID=196821 RepID=UPI0004F88E2C|nr:MULTISPECIES: type IVB secretion system protein IcmH/DotU [unclassified Pseudomonas]MCO8163805.1 type IVB secretion system protein IcmH/DotU [Pseudomonas sp. 21LCFQ010]MCQ9422395.1 type IVB secretion system protein IcmH/DotU [Pseudomonas sp. LJDD11]BAP45738.1 type VI secretion protein TssL2 [Pseudomonas sp. StFLB209]